MADSNNNNSGGIGFLGALAILFIGLKLGKVIDWSWWWVLSPLWIPGAFVLAVILIYIVYALTKALTVRRNK